MSDEIEELLKGFPVIVEQAIDWGDMDSFQHVNNIVYFRYFENSRIEYLRRIGWVEVEQETGVGPIVSALEAKFRKPLTFPDIISIGARLGTLGEDRFTLQHIIVSHDLAAIATEGEGTIVTFNYRENRKAPVPEKMREKIRKLEGKE